MTCITQDIPLNQLFVSDINVRKDLSEQEDENKIADLAKDIQQKGLLQPLIVREKEGRYEIIAGQRRFLACREAGIETARCDIRQLSDEDAEDISLSENIQRANLTNTEKVRNYNRIYERCGGDIDEAAKKINIGKETLKKYVQIGTLPVEVLRKLDLPRGQAITVDLAVSLSKLPHEVDRAEVLRKVEGLNNKDKQKVVDQFRKSESTNLQVLSALKMSQAEATHELKTMKNVSYVWDHERHCHVEVTPEFSRKMYQIWKEEKAGK